LKKPTIFFFNKTILILIVVFFLNGCNKEFNDIENSSDLEFLQTSIYRDFEPLWKLYLDSSNGGWKNNDTGRFSNDDAPAILALIELHKLTDDNRYIDKLKFLVKNILKNDDIFRGLSDEHRGNKILPGWSSTRYTSDNSRTIFLMNDALILISIINSYNYLKSIETSFEPPIEWLIRAENEFDLVFKPEWKTINSNKGYFEDIYYTKKDLNMPVNQYSIVGELCISLYNSTGNLMYKDYAIKTANYLKNELIKKTNSYVWYYKNPSVSYPSKRYDDFSHSQLVWRFIHVMYKQGLVFKKQDIELLKGTFKNEIVDKDKVFFYFGGMLNELKPAPENLIYKENPWLQYYYSLAMYDNEIKKTLKKVRENAILEYDPDSDFNHIGLFAILDFALAKKYLN